MKIEKMPELTRANIEKLLDVPYHKVLAYDYRTGELNQHEYAGYPAGVVSVNADGARRALESMPEMDNRKIVLAAVQGVAEMSWPGMNKFVKCPLNNDRSVFVSGNIIVYNPKTGLYEANPSGWMGLNIVDLIARRQYMGLQNFLFQLWFREQERRKFVEPFKVK